MAQAFPSDWRELVSLLVKHKVRFMIVGGHALGVIGRPRPTFDLDVFVDATPVNARKLHAALTEFGVGALADESFFASPQESKGLHIGVPPYRVDILCGISGVSFAEAWRGRRKMKFGHYKVNTIGRSAYIKNKLAAGRDKDLRDVATLEETCPRRR